MHVVLRDIFMHFLEFSLVRLYPSSLIPLAAISTSAMLGHCDGILSRDRSVRIAFVDGQRRSGRWRHKFEPKLMPLVGINSC